MHGSGSSHQRIHSQLRIAALAAIGTLVATLASASLALAQPLTATPSSTQPYSACPPRPAGEAACQAVIVPAGAKLGSMTPTGVSAATSGIDGSGLAPADLQSAYDLPSSSAGSGQTVALVDAYNDPTAESDLAAYRSAYGLPACTSAGGCFDKVNQTGGKTYPPQPDSEQGGWPVEESLDLDMVSAICPNCHILLVEASSASDSDLATAENEAVTLGATEVSNSWGGPEHGGETSFDAAFDHPGVPITVASGDYGYDNAELGAGVPSYPAASPYVIAVGGTDLVQASNARGWSETVWSRSGSGCSVYEPKPSYQTDSGCSKRTTNDIAAAAEDLSIYDTSGVVGEKLGGWLTVGGTSAATPIIAGWEALSGGETRSEGAAAIYKNSSSFFAVASGSNGSCKTYLCTGGSGYRGPTGVGTPDGVLSAGSSSPPAPAVSVTSVTPTEGSTFGGTTVTIKGSGFVSGATVKIGSKVRSVRIDSATEITAVTASASAGSDEVVVSDKKGVSSEGPSFTYVAPPAPTVTSISPAEGTTRGGSTVTITGTGFVSGATVRIGNRVRSARLVSETEMTAVTDNGAAGSDEVIVTDKYGVSSGGSSYKYVLPPAPSVASVTPDEGSTHGGTSVAIKGTSFFTPATVTIGGVAARLVKVRSETEITATTAANAAGSDEVVVSSEGGVSSGGAHFTYVTPPVPSVTSIAPIEGPTTGASVVTIKGANFTSGATVRIGGRALSVKVLSATEITAKTPTQAAGADEVVVSESDGVSSGGPRFTYKQSAPAATTSVALSCPSAQTCSGTLALAPAHAAQAASAARRATPVVLGAGAFSIAPGKTASVRLTLNSRGRRLLRSARGAVAVTLTVQGEPTVSASPQTRALNLDLIRKPQGSGRLERPAASRSGGRAAVSVGAA